MDRKKVAQEIYNMPVEISEKIRKLKELMLDCFNEMEAQDQNMHPEIKHKLSEGYRLAKDYLRELEQE